MEFHQFATTAPGGGTQKITVSDHQNAGSAVGITNSSNVTYQRMHRPNVQIVDRTTQQDIRDVKTIKRE